MTTTGTNTAALIRRWRMPASLAAEAARAAGELGHCSVERGRLEIGPQRSVKYSSA